MFREVERARRALPPPPSLLEHGMLRLAIDCDLPALLAIRRAAVQRGTDAQRLAAEIVSAVARDGLIGAVLDDGGG